MPSWLTARSLATQLLLGLGLGLFSPRCPVREPVGGILGPSHPVSITSGSRLFWSSHVTSHIPTLPPLQAPLGGGSGHQLVAPAQSVPLLHPDERLAVSKYWGVASCGRTSCCQRLRSLHSLAELGGGW